MNINSCRAVAGVVYALVLLFVHVPVGAGAGEIPSTATSRSLLVPGVFLDNENLVYQFPHRAVELPSEILASTYSSDYAIAAGANARTGRQAVFLLSQQITPFSYYRSLRMIQAGWALDAGRFAAGVAFRGGRLRDAMEHADVSSNDDRSWSEETVVDYREGAVGIGMARGGFRLDLVFEVFMEEFTSRAHFQSSEMSERSDLDPKDVILTKTFVRAEFPLSKTTFLVIGGGYRETSSAFAVTRTWTEPSQTPTSERQREVYYGHHWEGGFCLGKSLSCGGTGRFFASYVNDRKARPLGEAQGYSSYVQVTKTKDQTASVGFSLERPVWWECTMLAGFRNMFSYSEQLRFENRKPLGADEDRRTRESFGQSFAWGLRRSFRALSLTGAVQNDLEISDLFLSLDAQLLF